MAAIRRERADGAAPSGRAALAAVWISAFLVSFDYTAITVALSSLAGDFEVGTGRASWASLSYMLAMVSVTLIAGPAIAASQAFTRIAEPDAGLPALGEGGAGALANQPSLLLGEGGVEVEHEWVIRIYTKFGDNERHPLCHQSGDEGDVTGQPVELGDDHRTAVVAGCREGQGKLRPSLEPIGALAENGLDELGDETDRGRLGEAGDGGRARTGGRCPMPPERVADIIRMTLAPRTRRPAGRCGRPGFDVRRWSARKKPIRERHQLR